MTATICKAKDPSTCRVHGKKTEAADLFETAMKKLPTYAHMEAQVLYTKHMRKVLEDEYLAAGHVITEHIEGLNITNPEHVKVLEEYNADYETLHARMNEDERHFLHRYTGLASEDVNKRLRANPDFTTVEDKRDGSGTLHAKYIVKSIDSAMEKAEKKPRTLYRSISQDTTKEFSSSEEFATECGFVEGQTVKFSGFTSTTIDPHYINHLVRDTGEHTDVVLIIDTDEGIPVGKTPTTTKASHIQEQEREILLPRNMQFEVTKISRSVQFAADDAHEPVKPLTVYLKAVVS